MPDPADHSIAPLRLRDEVARQLLSRAAALDAERGATLDQVREAAVEAGIDPAAFERALQEFRSSTVPSPRGGFRALLAPLAAVGTFWVSLSILARVATVLGVDWPVRAPADVLTLALGAWVGRRLGARRTAAVLLGLAGGQAALYVVHLIYGIQVAQGAAVQWLAIGAGVAGAALATIRPPFRRPPAPLPDNRGLADQDREITEPGGRPDAFLTVSPATS